MREWKFQSSSSPKVYITQINPSTALLSCSCPGWLVKKQGKVRSCKHTRQVIDNEGLQIEERNEQQFVVEGPKRFDKVNPILRAETPTAPVMSAPESTKSIEGFISPMLASKMPEGKDADSYSNGDWIAEEKFDGHRIVVRIAKAIHLAPANVSAWSRLGNPRALPDHLVSLLREMPDGVYDGELIVPGQHSYDVTEGQNSGTERLVLFDMLEVLGQPIMKDTYAMRRNYLYEAFRALLDDEQDSISIALQFMPSMKMVREVWARGGEGAIIKNIKSRYQPGWRSPDWVKVKAVLAATLTVIGFEKGKNGPYSVVRLRDDAGIETTVKTLDNKTMRQIALNPHEFIGERLVISYHEKMPSGKYRHPMWDHLAGVGE